jgi:hypothetical protein
MRSRTLLSLSTTALLLTGCLGGDPHEAQPPRHHDLPEADAADRTDFPEPSTGTPREPGTTDDLLPRSGDPARPNVKVELSVVDVISWDDVKIRGGIRGSVVRGVVSLTGWLKGGASTGRAIAKTTQFIVIQAGHEGSISLSDPAVRELVGPYAALRVAVLDASDKGDIDVAVDPLVASDADGGQLTLATRVRVSSGEALVVGGYRSESEGDGQGTGGAAAGARKRDQLAILTATVLRSKP